ncbi:MAG: DUF2938 domain-containing protein [Alphaproteobacteria bacterium]|nr:DUF2938 domain-containing protein [Alphaproteobacteria bacterium]
MTGALEIATGTALVGLGATAFMDLWAVAQRVAFGIPSLNFALVGRWVCHMAEGRFTHPSIAKTCPARGERLVGWISHYLTGVLFAALLVGTAGAGWLSAPTLLPAVAIGVGTVLLPFLVMQPAFGLGIAASKTPRPAESRVRSLIAHASFGLGLYLSGLAWAMIPNSILP